MLALPDSWVWDLWTIEHDGVAHMFFLHAPRTDGDPELRHWQARVGHATSTDLRTWHVHGDALAPGPPGSWDDASTWTGSVVRDGDRWAMLYTGTSSGEDGLVQRVGLARSDDLHRWVKHPGPVIEADPRQYEQLDLEVWHDQAWRDPWVVRGADGRWHALLTARARSGPPFERGVVGHAVSDDLVDWEVLPPVSTPAGVGQLEVPQLVRAGSRWALVFASDEATQGSAGLGGTGTFHLLSDHPFGPFDGDDVRTIDAGGPPTTYAGRIHHRADGSRWFLAWIRHDHAGEFVGAVADPVPVVVRDDSSLVLDRPAGWPLA